MLVELLTLRTVVLVAGESPAARPFTDRGEARVAPSPPAVLRLRGRCCGAAFGEATAACAAASSGLGTAWGEGARSDAKLGMRGWRGEGAPIEDATLGARGGAPLDSSGDLPFARRGSLPPPASAARSGLRTTALLPPRRLFWGGGKRRGGRGERGASAAATLLGRRRIPALRRL